MKLTARYGNGVNNADGMKLQGTPLSLNVTGYYFYSSGALRYATSEGDYWSGAASSSAFAFELYFNSSSIAPSATNYRGNGMALRCVDR